MLKGSGKSVLKGIAVGKIYLYRKKEFVLTQDKVQDTEAEIERFEEARQKACEQLEALYEKAVKEAGEEQAMIFDVHRMMLDDGDYLDAIRQEITDTKVNAAWAVSTTGDRFAEMFASMDDDYMKARSADVLDISRRVARILSGADEE